MGARAMVAAGHELTAGAAEEVLRAGGNAYDAAVAAFFTACVAEPVLASPGGGGFLLALPVGGRPVVFDFFTHTPRRRVDEPGLDFRPVTVDFGVEQQEFHIGMASIAAPGCVRGLFEVHRRLGRMAMRELVQPALEAARAGIRVNATQGLILSVVAPIFTASPAARAIYGRAGEPRRVVREGDIVRPLALADTLEVLALEGEALFHRGEIARQVVEACRGAGGHLTGEDLAGFEVVLREPLAVDYRGARVLTNPPPSAGGMLIAFGLAVLAGYEGPREFDSPERLQAMVEALSLMSEARRECTPGTDDFCPDVVQLLDGETVARYRETLATRVLAARGTTHVSIIDSDGNSAALTVTNGEGCGEILDGTGIMLNNMLGEEDLNPHGFHLWTPNRRMSSMMAPSAVRWPDGTVAVTGSGGSNRIRSAILQVLVNLVDHGMSPGEAVCSPRVHFENGTVSIEEGFPAAAVEALLPTLADYRLWSSLHFFFGGAHTLLAGPRGRSGAGDPRRGGVFRHID